MFNLGLIISSFFPFALLSTYLLLFHLNTPKNLSCTSNSIFKILKHLRPPFHFPLCSRMNWLFSKPCSWLLSRFFLLHLFIVGFSVSMSSSLTYSLAMIENFPKKVCMTGKFFESLHTIKYFSLLPYLVDSLVGYNFLG